ncbi:M17 family metallopeptidase [Bacillus sp. S/N-304-OC-R1]|uniref:leucyl aminopeptidase family protein n=1 Tax=Bacillus sp. S/N-304-OC-R1 TaxID=2758034 RepID=UPI001C8DCDFE|nr:leucyl aminopeptidase family protein [Bacillus sp. S/N-304-OC-R1]MBY0122106.1 leucyl aminopeptidase family protein [Bacillus sp. S/N-304-OC-R1]
MSLQASILFSNDLRIQKNERIKQFIESTKADFTALFLGDELVVAIKEIEKEKQTYEKVRMIAGAITRELSGRKVEKAIVQVDALSETMPRLQAEELVTAFVEGWHLGAYKFVIYKSNETAFRTDLLVEGKADFHSSIKRGKIRAEAASFSRDLMNEVPNVLNPETFPSILQEEFSTTGVQVNVFNKEKLEEMEMNGVLTVGRGSKYKPSFVELVYKGDETKPLVALVGKGVTFDTGGISLKSGRDLSDMRMDMGGAAAVAGAMKLLAASKAQVNVVALIPIVENSPDNTSVLPGEIIRYKNGHTVQVGNTDAEGRLILADGLIRAGEWGAQYVVNIATLTGAIFNALGTKIAGVFGDEQLSVEMKEIGKENGDFVWPMPLVEQYDSYLKSDYADFSNISSKGEAGSITAGLFLRRFVPESCKWLHIDMAGVMESEEVGYYPKTATGFGARLLADFTAHVSR